MIQFVVIAGVALIMACLREETIPEEHDAGNKDEGGDKIDGDDHQNDADPSPLAGDKYIDEVVTGCNIENVRGGYLVLTGKKDTADGLQPMANEEFEALLKSPAPPSVIPISLKFFTSDKLLPPETGIRLCYRDPKDVEGNKEKVCQLGEPAPIDEKANQLVFSDFLHPANNIWELVGPCPTSVGTSFWAPKPPAMSLVGIGMLIYVPPSEEKNKWCYYLFDEGSCKSLFNGSDM